MTVWTAVVVNIVCSVAVVFCGCGLLWNAWSLMNVHRTHSDLMKVLSAISNRPMTGGHVLIALNAVPFEKHMRAYMLFRDPWKLYDPCVPDALVNVVTEVPVRFGMEPPEGFDDKKPTSH
jgi:hypothetical protein